MPRERRARATGGLPPIVAALLSPRTRFWANRERAAHGRPSSAPPRPRRGGVGGRRCVTPRQTCPRPNGLGRNLRSKTRWFTGFCNSHQVSHFATFFIDARAEISVAESRFGFSIETARPRAGAPRTGPRRRALFVLFSLARIAPGFRCWATGDESARGGARAPGALRGLGAGGALPPAMCN